MPILKFPRAELITQQRLRNYLQIRELLRDEELRLIGFLEGGVSLEPGEYTVEADYSNSLGPTLRWRKG